MRLIEEMPAAVRVHEAMGGVLDLLFFEGCDGSDAALRDALALAIGRAGGAGAVVDRAALDALRPREIGRDTFLGRWCDPATGALVHRGIVTTSDRRRLLDPTYAELATVRRSGATIAGSSGEIPETWAPGEFAYAFAQPPYSLRAGPAEVQAAFTAVLGLLLPDEEEVRILDWGDPALLGVSSHFAAGAEWWGVFLLTIHRPAAGRLVVVVGSATD